MSGEVMGGIERSPFLRGILRLFGVSPDIELPDNEPPIGSLFDKAMRDASSMEFEVRGWGVCHHDWPTALNCWICEDEELRKKHEAIRNKIFDVSDMD